MAESPKVTYESLVDILKDDTAVKVAGCDVDGVLRGKLMAKSKFLQIVKDGFGFCSVIFGWDMHDQTYFKELKISNKENGYRDIVAVPDLSTFRRIPWENNIPFFLVSFQDPDTRKSLSACPRSLLGRAVEALEERGIKALAGAEFEFYQFRAPSSQSDIHGPNTTPTQRFIRTQPPATLPHLTEGMLGYSLTDPVQNQDWFYDIWNTCEKFDCPIEGWHTESGPGVFEAALCYNEIRAMADRAALFKFVTKTVGSKYGITPCFMAKPREGLPGNSGHLHVSLADTKTGKNLFAREEEDTNAPHSDMAHLSDLGRHFLAGLLEGLPDVMPLFAPTVNSYKRLVENFWAPVTVSWGLEHRAASIRVIAPPTSSPKATRFEIRTPGADINPYLALATVLALGWRGVQKKLELKLPPLGKGEDVGGETDPGERLAKSLKEATARFTAKDSIAREVFGDEFVEHFGGTREHEVKLWEEAVTDWEISRRMHVLVGRRPSSSGIDVATTLVALHVAAHAKRFAATFTGTAKGLLASVTVAVDAERRRAAEGFAARGTHSGMTSLAVASKAAGRGARPLARTPVETGGAEMMREGSRLGGDAAQVDPSVRRYAWKRTRWCSWRHLATSGLIQLSGYWNAKRAMQSTGVSVNRRWDTRDIERCARRQPIEHNLASVVGAAKANAVGLAHFQGEHFQAWEETRGVADAGRYLQSLPSAVLRTSLEHAMPAVRGVVMLPLAAAYLPRAHEKSSTGQRWMVKRPLGLGRREGHGVGSCEMLSPSSGEKASRVSSRNPECQDCRVESRCGWARDDGGGDKASRETNAAQQQLWGRKVVTTVMMGGGEAMQ
ncbi:hypothetical protein FH972_021080 [Carpinus fangiana]|uniref:GS catalytic domain-containing protein n=1 Tax=Carpinus fangiana TaxID=176857 RepID=A0A5N6KNC9_9ROSI|nr:hypothetical protein FH972_021080 [Carpinus fangiana]